MIGDLDLLHYWLEGQKSREPIRGFVVVGDVLKLLYGRLLAGLLE
jgi:hypothetical protein